MALKTYVKQRMPWLTPLYSYLHWTLRVRPKWRKMGMAVFTEHYRNNGWGCAQSASGEGSTLEQSAAIRSALPQIVRDFNVRTMLDIPCGDFNWMKLVDLPVAYTGADIVPELVADNQRRFPSRSFVKLDIAADVLPKVDLILCRDCLFHFSYRHIFEALANIKRSGSRMLLTTTNTHLVKNRNIVTGEWRRLNLQREPFNFPPPLLLVDEDCPNPAAPDKHMGLWNISEIPDAALIGADRGKRR